jgi:hypothetical protein
LKISINHRKFFRGETDFEGQESASSWYLEIYQTLPKGQVSDAVGTALVCPNWRKAARSHPDARWKLATAHPQPEKDY